MMGRDGDGPRRPNVWTGALFGAPGARDKNLLHRDSMFSFNSLYYNGALVQQNEDESSYRKKIKIIRVLVGDRGILFFVSRACARGFAAPRAPVAELLGFCCTAGAPHVHRMCTGRR